MAQVILSGISKRYGDQPALHPTDLTVADGEFLTLLGPSGCGKTTLLRIVAGFVEPSAGTIRLDGEDVTRLPPNRRSIGMVFQDYALFPHLTIAENIAFSLRERGAARGAIRARVAELLDLIRLPGIGDRLPAEISGGQQQRVAFARAIAHPPRVLLMDEPLGALDLKLREDMQFELRRLQRDLGITTLYVTHDQSEAMNLSDRIAVMADGRIIQCGTARAIYDRPASRFVAEFVGQINLLPVRPQGRQDGLSLLRADGAVLRAPADDAARPDDLVLAVRPQHVSIVAGNGAGGHGVPHGHNRLPARVLAQVFNGNLVHIQVETAGATWTVETRPNGHDFAPGAEVTLHWPPADSLVLEA